MPKDKPELAFKFTDKPFWEIDTDKISFRAGPPCCQFRMEIIHEDDCNREEEE